MATSDDYFRLWVESLAAEGIDAGDLEAELIGRIGRLRSRRDRMLRDMEVARLLPFGAEAVRARFGGCRATAYNRAQRGRKLSKSCDGS
jgi:hypothetical protein